MNNFLKILVCWFFVISLTVAFYFWNLRSVGFGEEQSFVITQGESVNSIANRLHKKGLIKNKLVFMIYLRVTGQIDKVQSGLFQLSPENSIREIVDVLKSGREDFWVTLLEGWRREQMAEELAEKLNFTKTEFLDASKELEGYLFPDTYLLPLNASASEVVNILTKNFYKKLVSVFDGDLEFTQEQIVILASLLEREANSGQDLPIIAGILIKRWKSQWPLQIDATIQYLKGSRVCVSIKEEGCNWWPSIAKEDLSLDSSYNTYLYKGLPPSPICNPSLSAIKAVVDYQPSEYWFYLSDINGKIHYARTIEEHNKNIDFYLKRH